MNRFQKTFFPLKDNRNCRSKYKFERNRSIRSKVMVNLVIFQVSTITRVKMKRFFPLKDNRNCRSKCKFERNRSIRSEVMAEKVLFSTPVILFCVYLCVYLCKNNTKLGSCKGAILDIDLRNPEKKVCKNRLDRSAARVKNVDVPTATLSHIACVFFSYQNDIQHGNFNEWKLLESRMFIFGISTRWPTFGQLCQFLVFRRNSKISADREFVPKAKL